MTNRADRHEQGAIFWCSLLQPLLCGEIPPQEAADFLRELTETERLFPDGQLRKPSRATLYRKWKQYRDGGFDALLRQRRSDRRKARKNRRKRQAMIDRAIELKKDQPRRSEEPINQFLRDEFQETLPKATLYRHLKQAGATPTLLRSVPETGSFQTKGSPPLDSRSDERLVGRRLRRRPLCVRR